MNFPWFKRFGILFIPITIMGWAILIAGIVYAVWLFMDIDSRSHSVSDTLRPYAIWLIILGIIYSVIGYLSIDRNKK
jgi:hypothetical protein